MVVGLQLPMQSVPITTNVQITLRRGVLVKMLCDKVNAHSYEAIDNKMDIDTIVPGVHTLTIRDMIYHIE
jgi:hypothetical protein